MATLSSYGSRDWERHLDDPDEYNSPQNYAVSALSADTQQAFSEISRRYIKSREQGAELVLKQVGDLKKRERGMTKAQMKESITQKNKAYQAANNKSMDAYTEDMCKFIDDSPQEEAEEVYNIWQSFMETIKDFLEEIKDAVIGALWELLRFFGAVWEGLKAAYTEVKKFFVSTWEAFKSVFS